MKDKKMTAKLSDSERNRVARIIALFSVMIRAWQINDFAEAARTRAQLEKFGVKVRILGRRSKRQGMGND